MRITMLTSSCILHVQTANTMGVRHNAKRDRGSGNTRKYARVNNMHPPHSCQSAKQVRFQLPRGMPHGNVPPIWEPCPGFPICKRGRSGIVRKCLLHLNSLRVIARTYAFATGLGTASSTNSSVDTPCSVDIDIGRIVGVKIPLQHHQPAKQ